MSRFAQLWYRALLLLYPSGFRRQFGAEMLRVLADQERQARTLSRGERCWRRCRAAWDLIVVGIRERAAAMSAAVRGIGMVLIAAAAMQVIYDMATPKLSMGVGAWALTLSVCSLGVLLITARTGNNRRRYG